MSENGTNFRTVMRGYDPIQVDRRVSELAADSGAANLQIADLQRRVDDLSESVRTARQQATAATESAATPVPVVPPAPPTFEQFGARIGQIMRLAEEEAEDLRAAVAAEAETKIASIEAMSIARHIEADEYLAVIKSTSERDAARLLSDAKRTVDQLIDDAERQASARRHEADSVYEAQRAQSAQAAADVEQALAERRTTAERAIADRSADAEREIVLAQEHAVRVRSEADAAAADAAREAIEIGVQAQMRAEHVIADAVERAARIRVDADREVSAAAQRRDSINAQLANVRTVLATMTASVPQAEPSFDASFESSFAPASEPIAPTLPSYEVGAHHAADDPFGPVTTEPSLYAEVHTVSTESSGDGHDGATDDGFGHRIAS